MNDDYGFKVYGWMIHKLRLKGNELLCFALIYKECKFFGSCPMTQKELCAQTGISIVTVGKILKKLCDKGYLIKESYSYQNLKYYSYKVSEEIYGKVQG